MDNDSHLLPENSDSTNAREIEELAEKHKEIIESEMENKEDPLGWEDEEAEIVIDHKAEDYKEEFTGIKIRYNLTYDEIKKFVSKCKEQEVCQKKQIKHFIIEGTLAALLNTIAWFSESRYFYWMAAIPLIALVLMWAVPVINSRVYARNLLNENEFTVDIFPDRLEIDSKSGKRTMFLDNTCQSEEYKDMIMIFKANEPGVVIPLRAIDPDFRADVQAIVVAGSTPTDKHYSS